jgi:hypothetical protein
MMYISYDTEKEFLPQLNRNFEIISDFFRKSLSIASGIEKEGA